MGWNDALRAAVDLRHVVPFALLFALTQRAFDQSRERAPALKAMALVLSYSILLEYAQSFFTEGHCRVWDVAANGFGMAWGWLGVWAARRLSSSPSSR